MSNAEIKLIFPFYSSDPITGLIITVKSLDRETKSSYNMILEVSDNGEPPQAATRVLHINVLDVDDHKPHFEREIVSHRNQHLGYTLEI